MQTLSVPYMKSSRNKSSISMQGVRKVISLALTLYPIVLHFRKMGGGRWFVLANDIGENDDRVQRTGREARSQGEISEAEGCV